MRSQLRTGFGSSCPWVWCAWLALWLSDCSLLIEVDGQQCVADSDCRQLGLAAGRCVDGACQLTRLCDQRGACAQACGDTLPCGDPADVCLKSACADALEVRDFVCSQSVGPSTQSVTFQASVRELASMQPPKGLTVSACELADLDCVAPLAHTADLSSTGDIALELPWGFSGYLELRGDELTTVLYYLDHPLYGPTEAHDVFVTTRAAFDQTAALSGALASTDGGLIVVQMYDCAEHPAAGIHFEVDVPAAVPFFLVYGTASMQTRTSVYDGTLGTAIGGFANVTPGAALVSARLGTRGPRLDWYNVHVRARSVTQLALRPYPDVAK